MDNIKFLVIEIDDGVSLLTSLEYLHMISIKDNVCLFHVCRFGDSWTYTKTFESNSAATMWKENAIKEILMSIK